MTHICVHVDNNLYLMDSTIHTFGDFQRFILTPDNPNFKICNDPCLNGIMIHKNKTYQLKP